MRMQFLMRVTTSVRQSETVTEKPSTSMGKLVAYEDLKHLLLHSDDLFNQVNRMRKEFRGEGEAALSNELNNTSNPPTVQVSQKNESATQNQRRKNARICDKGNHNNLTHCGTV